MIYMSYRKGIPPLRRRMEARQAIIKALRDGEKTFGQLLNETGMSRSTLSFHLKNMHKNREVNRRTDTKDYRVTCYSLTSKGSIELHRQEDIETLSSGELMFPPPKMMAELADRLVEFLKPAIQQELLHMEMKDSPVLKECITFSIYSNKPLKGEGKDYVESLAELATASMLVELAILTRRRAIRQFKQIPDLRLVFRLNRTKIEEYLRKVEAEIDKEPLPKLPDIKKYAKKKKIDAPFKNHILSKILAYFLF
jgi:DNA-binding MarR family transcriptional regulator